MPSLNRFVCTLTLLAALLGCRKGEESVRFTADAFDWDETVATALAEGTEVGILSGESLAVPNVRAAVSGGELVPESPVYWTGAQGLDTPFLGYAPYNPSASGLPFSFSVRQDQGTLDAYSASDLIASSALVSPGLRVRFHMRHVLARLIIKLSGETEVTGTVISVVLRQVPRTGTMTVIPNGFSDLSDYGDINALYSDGAYYALFFPDALGLSFEIMMSNGKLYTCTLPSVMQFEGGKSYYTEINLSDAQIVTGGDLAFTVSVSDWSDGGIIPFE